MHSSVGVRHLYDHRAVLRLTVDFFCWWIACLYPGLSLCRAEIITGRMHQVRVHLKVGLENFREMRFPLLDIVAHRSTRIPCGYEVMELLDMESRSNALPTATLPNASPTLLLPSCGQATFCFVDHPHDWVLILYHYPLLSRVTYDVPGRLLIVGSTTYTTNIILRALEFDLSCRP